uniref:Fruit body lectin n=1 Tax=Dumortiera hirsuta TaxID=56917 RepID=A0A455I7L4_DUMHI|nr:fruit body lectin [Dumortiera hirsuta]
MAMSYTIRVRVIQKDPAKWFSIGEKTVWHYANGGTWTKCDGELTLTMGGSGTSGTLRFKNPQGEYFLVALGVHNYKHWCDILPNLSSSNTGVEIHPKYYVDGSSENAALWKQAGELEKKSSNGTTIAVKYYKEDGKTFYATITIN